MRKFLTFIVVSLMAASILSSCKKDENGTTPSEKYPATLDGTYAKVDASAGSSTILYVETLGDITYASFIDVDKDEMVSSADGVFSYNSNKGEGEIKNGVKGGPAVSVQAVEGTTSDLVYVTVANATPGSEPLEMTLMRAGEKKMKEGYWERYNKKGGFADMYMEIAQDSVTKAFSGVLRQMRSFNAAEVCRVSDFVEFGSEWVGVMSLLGFGDDSVAVVLSKYNYDDNIVTLFDGSREGEFSNYSDLGKAPQYNPADIQGFVGVWTATNASTSDKCDVFIFNNLGGVYSYVVHPEPNDDGGYDYVTAVEGAVKYEPEYGLGEISMTTQGSAIGKIWAERINYTPAFDLSVKTPAPKSTDGTYYCEENKSADIDTLPVGSWSGNYYPIGMKVVYDATLVKESGKGISLKLEDVDGTEPTITISITSSSFVTLDSTKGIRYGVFGGTEVIPGSVAKHSWFVTSHTKDENKWGTLTIKLSDGAIDLQSNAANQPVADSCCVAAAR